MGLVVSHGLPPLPAVGFLHWLSQSGYLPSPNAGAAPSVASTAASTSAPIAFRSGMTASLSWPRAASSFGVGRQGCRAADSSSTASGIYSWPLNLWPTEYLANHHLIIANSKEFHHVVFFHDRGLALVLVGIRSGGDDRSFRQPWRP